jgi:hypothetical protein
VSLINSSIGGDLNCTKGTFKSGKSKMAIRADRLDVKGAVLLSDGFRAEGQVSLVTTSIGADLDCSAGTFVNAHDVALDATQLNVKGRIFLGSKFSASGKVRLVNASAGGIVDCSAGVFANPQGIALNAERLDAKGGVLLREGFKAQGEVSLLNASIGGDLDCSQGNFDNLDKPGDVALRADRMEIKGAAFLRKEFQARGEVRIAASSIGRDLDCSGGVFHNPGGAALLAERINVRGSVLLGLEFRARGDVRFNGSSIGVDLICNQATFEAYVDLLSVRITCLLRWMNVNATEETAPEKSYVRLANCSVERLEDNVYGWNKIRRMNLDGFVYLAILWPSSSEGSKDRLTLDQRLAWLRQQDGQSFSLQPYGQLAHVLN